MTNGECKKFRDFNKLYLFYVFWVKLYTLISHRLECDIVGNLGSFSPFKNPDIDRFSYFLGQMINPDGKTIISGTNSSSFLIGNEKGGTISLLFNTGENKAGVRWNQEESRLEFSWDGLLWYPLEKINAGLGINASGSPQKTISVDLSDIIDTNNGLCEDNGKIQVKLLNGGGLRFNSGSLECYFGEPLLGNVLWANGTGWESKTPEDANIVTLSGDQNITGSKTFTTNQSFSSFLDLEEITEPESPPAGTVRLFARNNLGKTELCAKFSDGTVVTLASQP